MPNFLSDNGINKNYFHFMRWFQNSHPDLYVKYWKSIKVPKLSEEIDIVGSAIDLADHKRLIQIEYDYYSGQSSK